MIVRGLAGVIIGLAYGFFVSAVVFVLTRIDLKETTSSSLIMIDPVTMAWVATVLSGIIAGVCAILVGLIVGMARLSKGKAATIGFVVGLLVLGVLSIDSHLPTTLHAWIELFVAIAILPIGMALTGMFVAIVAERLYRHEP